MVHNTTLNAYEILCNSSTKDMVLLVVFFIVSIGITCACFYFNWCLKKCNTNNKTTIYERNKW